jgi:hypothetical protein
MKKTYTWEQINDALLEEGIATPKIAEILSRLVKNEEEDN